VWLGYWPWVPPGPTPAACRDQWPSGGPLVSSTTQPSPFRQLNYPTNQKEATSHNKSIRSVLTSTERDRFLCRLPPSSARVGPAGVWCEGVKVTASEVTTDERTLLAGVSSCTTLFSGSGLTRHTLESRPLYCYNVHTLLIT
jgi:hypothetical protein